MRSSVMVALVLMMFMGCAATTDFDKYASQPDAGGTTPRPGDDDDASKGDDDDTVTPPEDSGADTGVPGEVLPRVLQTGTGHDVNGVISATIAASKAGDLIVVAIANENDGRGPVTTVTDDIGNTYVSANARSNDANCDDSSEIWFAKNVKPGATKITVKMTDLGANRQEAEVWVIEAEGFGENAAVDAKAQTNSAPTSATLTAPPVTTTVKRALIVSSATSCEDVQGLKAGSLFTNLTILEGEATAWMISSDIGSFGAVWDAKAGTSNASTVAFKP